MFVKERMSRPVITAHPDMPIQDAINLMHKEHIRRLPIVDKRGKLVGIVSESDLLHAAPSHATSLSVWELTFLLSKVKIEEIMERDVITVTEGTPLEDAARIMADSKIGGLPVVRDSDVVGIITETDLFKVFLEMLGAREAGVRMAALIRNVPGELAKLTEAVFELGGNIVAMGTILGETPENREITMKVEGVSPQDLEAAVKPLVERIIDIRSSQAT